ncbi:MAG: hypothetical protein ABEI98_01540 [Halorhabdus sp.]
MSSEPVTSTSSTPPPRPALPVLQDHQAELIDRGRVQTSTVEHDLRGGFPSRRAVIEWYQRAVVRSFGELAEDLPPRDLARDEVLLANLLEQDVGNARQPVAPEARLYRRRLEAIVVLPAFNRAYNQLRKMAGEYLSDEERRNKVDPGRVVEASGDQSVALRPAFSRKDEEQHNALARLWGGFEREEDLLDWLHVLDAPTNGAIDEELPAMIRSDRVAKNHLLRGRMPRAEARSFRERFAILELLPAFVEGIERMDTGELAKQTSQKLEVTPG